MTESTEATVEQTEEPAATPDNTVVPIRRDDGRTSSLEIISGQRWWTPGQLAALASIGLAECPDGDRMAFLHLCQSTGLDPFRKEIYLLGRKVKDGDNWTIRWTPQTGIDGFRHLAEETGVYGGRVGPQWAGPDGVWRDVWLDKEPPRAARTGVIRTDRPAQCRKCGGPSDAPAHGVLDDQHSFEDERITWAIALYDEYVPMEKVYAGSGQNRTATGDERPTSMWRKMPANQLAKCSEAASIRAAFPRRAAGLYEHAEMDAATQAAKEVEEGERDKQRRELADRPWAQTPSGSKGVVLGEAAAAAPAPAVTYDRTVLLAELEEQARAAGKTVTQYTTRWAAAHKKNIDQATDAELDSFLEARRGAERPAVEATATEAPEPAADAPAAATDAGDAPVEAEQTSLLSDETAEEEMPPLHQFEGLPDNEAQCAWCDAAADDPTAHLG